MPAWENEVRLTIKNMAFLADLVLAKMLNGVQTVFTQLLTEAVRSLKCRPLYEDLSRASLR
jgi:hypothetical protein